MVHDADHRELNAGNSGLQSFSGCCGQAFGFAQRYREPHDEDGAASGFVLAGDLPMMILHHAVSGAQAKTRAFPDGLRRIERIENLLGFENARAAVREFDHYFSAFPSRTDPQRSASNFFEGVRRVVDDLQA